MDLICAECKNKWMPSNRINEVICPYCGNIIGKLSRELSSFEEGITYIKDLFGDDIFEQRRFFFICINYCLENYAKEISALKILYDSGLNKRILDLRGSDSKTITRARKQFAYQLRMKNGMDQSWAEYIIELFCSATGVSTDNVISNNILAKIRKAEMGDSDAQYQVGICYKDGKDIKRSLDNAKKWLRLSADQKHSEAMVALYQIYAKENNGKLARKYLEEAVGYGNVNAMNSLAYCLLHSKDGYELDIEKAITLLDSGVSKKSIVSMRRRADIYLEEGDVERAAELLKMAGEMNDIASLVKYAWISFPGAKDFGKGVELKNFLEKGIINGSIDATYYLARVYEGDYIIPRNIDASIRWYKKAAVIGHIESAKRLAELYLYGCDELKIDKEQARDWYMQAAASGDEDSLKMISLKNPESPFREYVDIEFDDGQKERLDIAGMRIYDGNFYLKIPEDNDNYVYIKYIEHTDGSMEFESIDEKMYYVIDKQGEIIY